MHHIFSATLPIFLIALIGSLAKRNWLKSEEFWRGLEKLSYYLIFPCVLFNSIANVNLKAVSIVKLASGLTISTLIIGTSLVIYQRLLKINPVLFTSIFQGAIRYNSYIFLAVSKALFGDQGIVIVSIISSYMIILTNLLSVTIFAIYIPKADTTTKSTSKILLSIIFTNPLIISSIAGFIFNYCGFTLNLGVKNTISNIASSAFTIGMLNIGAGLKLDFNISNIKPIVVVIIVKLLIFPIVTLAVFSMMKMPGLEKSVGILYSCLPCATTSNVLSRQLKGDPESMIAIITLSTILSVCSLSILAYIFNLKLLT